ncbi:MAG: preprotein translocase subunit SecE [Deltaproteobacteria bacterium]|nr:preprotein translocase subunit SecE [Deltaproteobacteria bacterium]NCP95260.1 preprotein translocase subunit SecE [Deltaproteobacteria bacterium]NCS74562.1 preprotein translocase subunit SecE [Deltaproteobacteria bacterium]
MQFIREVRAELGNVSWPTRDATVTSTVVVLITVFLIGAFLGGLDIGLSRLVGFLVG